MKSTLPIVTVISRTPMPSLADFRGFEPSAFTPREALLFHAVTNRTVNDNPSPAIISKCFSDVATHQSRTQATATIHNKHLALARFIGNGFD